MLTSNSPQVSRRTARRNLERGVKFLGTLSRVPEVRAALDEGAGYSEAHHAEGWRLLLSAMGYGPREPASPATAYPQQAALLQLDEWDGVNFERTRATLRYRFPEQHEYLFRGLTAASGADAIGTVQTFVDRVVALRDGTDPNRSSTRAEDQQAAERLAERHIFTSEIQAQLEGLLAQAKQLAPAPLAPATEDEVQQAADELHVWLSDWTGQARAFITRGDYLVRLGLGSRRGRSEGDEDDVEEDATAEEVSHDLAS